MKKTRSGFWSRQTTMILFPPSILLRSCCPFTHMNRAGYLPLYEASRIYALSRAIAHAATKRELVAKQGPSGWTPPSMFRALEVLTEAEVTEAEAELKALQRHALEVIDPETGV